MDQLGHAGDVVVVGMGQQHMSQSEAMRAQCTEGSAQILLGIDERRLARGPV